jgi:hypothetical protein
MRQGVGAILGRVDAAVAEDFPSLQLWSMACEAPARVNLRDRLKGLDDRVRGIATGRLRTDTVAGAYRAFARQIGLDPDVDRNPLDQAAVDRLMEGEVRSTGVIPDALLVAMLETHVPLWALDGDEVSGPLHVRTDDGRLSVLDDRRALAPLLGRPPKGIAVTKKTVRAVVYALQVKGVPATTIEEAFWHARACLGDDTR